MTAKAAIAQALLRGKILNVKNCFGLFGITNCARECSRMIERPFGVRLTRTQKEGKSRYGQAVIWVDYSLPQTPENKEGIQKMKDYVKSQSEEANVPRGTIDKSIEQMNHQEFWDALLDGKLEPPQQPTVIQGTLL